MGNNVKGEKRVLKKKQKDMLFVFLITLLPFIQFFIFYICVNFNSFIMAFQNFDMDIVNKKATYVWNNFENFKKLYHEFIVEKLFFTCIKNSAIYYLCSMVIGTTLALVFSYYIFKNRAGNGFFKVVLFMPSIISSIVMIVMFRFFVNIAIPHLLYLITGTKVEALLLSPDTAFPVVIFYNIWAGFGTSILLYSGAMTNISVSVIEAGKIDGVGFMREFWQLVIPLIFSTLKTFIISGAAAMFISDIGLYSFFENSAEKYLYTFGYFIISRTRQASLAEYPYLASVGVALTLIAMPITLLIRRLLDRFDPSLN